jgi:hypothetical protein
MESKHGLIRKHTKVTKTVEGVETTFNYPAAMQEFSDQQNAYMVEALDYALQTIMLQSQGKPIRDLDERIAHFEQILKENGK